MAASSSSLLMRSSVKVARERSTYCLSAIQSVSRGSTPTKGATSKRKSGIPALDSAPTSTTPAQSAPRQAATSLGREAGVAGSSTGSGSPFERIPVQRRVTELQLQRFTNARWAGHRGAVAALELGVVGGDVRRREESFAGGSVVRVGRHSHTGRDPERLARAVEGQLDLIDPSAHLLGDLASRLERFGRQQQADLVTAEACGDALVGGRDVGDHFGGGPDEPVSHQLAVTIVDHPEQVQVDHRDGQPRAPALRRRQSSLQFLYEVLGGVETRLGVSPRLLRAGHKSFIGHAAQKLTKHLQSLDGFATRSGAHYGVITTRPKAWRLSM